MSLHFDLMINKDQIARVIIQRIRTSKDKRSPHTYRWVVLEPDGFTAEGNLLHHERFGAMRLAASVLTAYEARTRRALRRKPGAPK